MGVGGSKSSDGLTASNEKEDADAVLPKVEGDDSNGRREEALVSAEVAEYVEVKAERGERGCWLSVGWVGSAKEIMGRDWEEGW